MILLHGCAGQRANRPSVPYATPIGGVEGWLIASNGERVGVEARLSNGGSWVLVHRPAERCGTGWLRVPAGARAGDYFRRSGTLDVENNTGESTPERVLGVPLTLDQLLLVLAGGIAGPELDRLFVPTWRRLISEKTEIISVEGFNEQARGLACPGPADTDRATPPGARHARSGLTVELGPLGGLMVVEVAPGSPAERNGVAARDLLLAIGTKTLLRPDEVPRILDAGRDPKVLRMYRGMHAVVVPRIPQLALGADCTSEILSAGLTRVGQFLCWTLPSE